MVEEVKEEATARWHCSNDKPCANKAACRHRKGDGQCVYEYDADGMDAGLAWSGPGSPPSSWRAGGMKVYRSYADYCWD